MKEKGLICFLNGRPADKFNVISHVTLYGNPVPVPAAILLLGSGLVGLTGFRRKLKKELD